MTERHAQAEVSLACGAVDTGQRGQEQSELIMITEGHEVAYSVGTRALVMRAARRNRVACKCRHGKQVREERDMHIRETRIRYLIFARERTKLRRRNRIPSDVRLVAVTWHVCRVIRVTARCGVRRRATLETLLFAAPVRGAGTRKTTKQCVV
jgi:hypothetical protein